MRPHTHLRKLVLISLALSLILAMPGQALRAAPAALSEASPEQALSLSWVIAGDPSPLDVQTAPLAAPPEGHTIRLKSRQFQPGPSDAASLQDWAARGPERVHLLVQLDYIPRDRVKAELGARDLTLLAYVPDYAWIASLPAQDAAAALDWPGVTWIGELTVDDKLAPDIREDRWSEFNLAPDGTAAVYLLLHPDETLETGRALVAAHGGTITGEAVGIRMLMVELPKAEVRALAAEDAVQWVEPAAPPLTGANDGLRAQIGVDVLHAAPYNLDGTGVDILVYDSGQVGNHTDFGSRLTHGDTDSVTEHSTHVAGTAGGSGSVTPQWQGMAPNADLISYGTSYPAGTGAIFYARVPDIEADWAQAQNLYSADLGTASLGSNVYQNYPSQCATLLGKYGAASVLIDQIVRGGNSAVGTGDKYIATWAAGNERGAAYPYCGSSYGTVTPPAAAKNPIHVGGSNTNNNTQYAHTSWGPTEDGRLKPIVTAGACQTSGDFGITSTDDSPANTYTTMCGTSMATPAVAGGIALMLQHYRAVYSTSGMFWPSAAKAILMQTATDFGNPGPDYQWGYGQVDIHAAVDLISRKAFRQDNVGAGQVDVYSLIVPQDGAPLTVSLAWDDYEATLNANPTLINNLDLELVAPSGTIWRPWVLNPSSPGNNATRGVDNRNNQEQVQVPSPEIGTWLVRVRGTTVPQGPQDYALVCEGCKPLGVGVCQEAVAGAALAQGTASAEDEAGTLVTDPESGAEVRVRPQVVLSEGERWQRALEAGILADMGLQGTATEDGAWVPQAPGPYTLGSPDPAAQARTVAIREALSALEAARQAGPEALLALREKLPPDLLDLVGDEIAELQEQWADGAASPPDTGPVSEAEEQAARQALEHAEAAARAVALADHSDPAENGAAVQGQAPAVQGSVDLAAADRTVGAGCTYATIGAAIADASPGDRLRIEGGVTFNETVVINKNLTLEGGYDGCASGSSAHTTIDAGESGSVVTIGPGLDVTLEQLNLTNGSSEYEGGGIEFALNPGSGTLHLADVRVYGNAAQWGGGIWVGMNAEVTGSDVQVYDNTATAYGGGVRLYGGRLTLSNSNIYNNSAPLGGGVYGTRETYSPALNLPSAADVSDNQALTGDGLGGGIYMRQGAISMADCSDLSSNDAIRGGGAYVVTSTLTIDGDCSEIEYNTATGHGGGVYAQGSTINLDDAAELWDNDAGTGGSGSGGGAYLDGGGLWADKASIRYNSAASFAGGVYATNSATVDMDLGAYACLGGRCSRLYANTASGSYGGGIYAAAASRIYLDNTHVEANVASLGGGIYAIGSQVYLNSTLLARNNATSASNVGDAVRLYNGSTMSGSGNTIAYNQAGGAATGQALGVFGSDLSLSCSIIWGHSSSIDTSGHNVSYSDVQGGYAGTANLNVNPLFVSSGSYDYHLQTTSPVIDRCLTGPGTDMDGELRPIVRASGASPYDMGADEVAGVARVGLNGTCIYATIQQALNAAADGDTVRVAAGTYFENVNILGKSIAVEGGYDGTCATVGSNPSRIEGSAGSGSTVDVTGGTVTLRNLQVAWGSSTGAGLDVRGGAQLTLDHVHVLHNHGTSGGGIYIDSTSTVTAGNDSDVRDNTATVQGGGVRVLGQFYGTDTNSDIYDNCAPHGGGVSVAGGVLHLDAPDVYRNLAADAAGQGGGILVAAGGVVTLTGNAWVYSGNQAFDGAGIYADGATVYLGNATLRDNLAAHDGGGLYLANASTLHSAGAQVGSPSAATANEAQRGGGIYADESTISFSGTVVNNFASSAGAGIYATGSTLALTNATVGGTGSYQANVVPAYGAGLYLANGTQATLDGTTVAGNRFQVVGINHGGGAYVTGGSALTLTDSLIAHHEAPSTSTGRGAGIYLSNGTVTLQNSQVVSNTAGTNGGAVRMWGTSTLHVQRGSSISYSESLSGEGGAIAATGTATIDISGAVLAHNSAGTVGGAVYQEGAGSALEVQNSLLHGNASTGPWGAAIRIVEGSSTVTHVTLAGNLGGPAVSSDSAGSSAFNSIAWGNPSGGFAGSFGSHGCNIDQSSTVGSNVDPRFVSPGTDYHLQSSSPAVDACTSGLPIDLDGAARPSGAGYDMGAYEYTFELIFLPVVLRDY